jgi:hypothetical protein
MIIEAVNNFGDTREGASAGPMALAVVALLAIATVLLWRNMTARIKRLPASFPDQSGPAAPAPTTEALATEVGAEEASAGRADSVATDGDQEADRAER